MPNLERDCYIYEIDGANALKPKLRQIQPALRIVRPESEILPSNVISFLDFKSNKENDLLVQQKPLFPSANILRNLRKEITLISNPVKEVPAIETKKPEESKTQTPDLLKGTGFTSKEEVDSLKKKLNEGLVRGEDKRELVNRIITENLTNIRWYQWEYTMSDPILPNPVAQNENGELVNSKSGYSVVAMTGEGERDGSVKHSVINAQNLLKDAEIGDTVMIVSPPGWTGRIDENGNEIKYREAEVFAFIKGEGRNIRALTFISELTLEQCQQLKDHFIKPNSQVEDNKLNEREKIVQMVASPILVTGGKVRFGDILDRVEAIKGGKIMREAKGANRTFAEARQFLARGDELQKLPDLCEEIIQTYESYLKEHIENINDPNIFKAIKQRMELTVLEIAKTLKGDKTKELQKEMSFFYKQAMSANSVGVIDQRLVVSNYNEQIAYLRTRPGCNGGASESPGIFGSSLSEILGGFSAGGGRGIVEASSGLTPRCIRCKLELCEGRCPNCENKAKAA